MKASSVPELKGGQMLTIAYFIGILIVLFIVYKILAGLGLVKTSAAKKADATKADAVNQLRTNDIFNPDYYKGKSFKALGAQAAELHAQELRDAMNGFGTDEEAIFTTFGKLYNKLNVSELADYYRQNKKWYQVGFGEDLQTDLLNELNDKDIATLWSIINSLPNN